MVAMVVSTWPLPLLVRQARIAQGGKLSQRIDNDASMSVVYGRGNGCTLEFSGSGTGLCIPLRGLLEVSVPGEAWALSTGTALVVSHNMSIKAVGYANSSWIVLVGAREAWQGLLRSVCNGRRLPLPELHSADHELRRLAMALVRSTSIPASQCALRSLAAKFASMQAPLQPLMLRCPGRTLTQKHQVFLRLQRVRQVMKTRCDQALDIEVLASMASYCTCHFVRVFHKVYGTTPYAYLVAQRMECAKGLLQSSGLAVADVAIAAGFDSRASFSRQFRSHFGITAREAQRRAITPAAIA